jgi:hypothetical protein
MAGKNTDTAQNGTTEEKQTADILRDEIRIDESSGISAEEQREILVQINGIAEKNRQSLAAGAGSDTGKEKKRKAKRKL